MKTKYMRNGREVSDKEWSEGLEKDLYESIADQIKENIGEMKCPTHGKSPTVVLEESRAGIISGTCEFCCTEFKKEFEEKSCKPVSETAIKEEETRG